MARVPATNQDDLDLPNYDSDGKSSVDINETTPQLPGPDGESSIEVGEYAGADRVTESVQGNVPEFKEAEKAEKVAGADNIGTGDTDTEGKDAEKTVTRRGRKPATEEKATEESTGTKAAE